MARKTSMLAPGWWDYTTLDNALLDDVAKLNANDLQELSREGFRVVFYDTIEDFYLAEALEYIAVWRQATPDDPVGICGPIGPTEQLPLVTRLVNEFNLDLSNAHFWGMDEWYQDGKELDPSHPLSFEKADRDLCFNRIRPELRMPEQNLHFPKANVTEYIESWESGARCAISFAHATASATSWSAGTDLLARPSSTHRSAVIRSDSMLNWNARLYPS